MSQLILNIKDNSIKEKILWMLEHFQSDGLEIQDNSSMDTIQETWTDEYIEENWREIGMATHSADLDDDERLYEACAEFYNDKHSS